MQMESSGLGEGSKELASLPKSMQGTLDDRKLSDQLNCLMLIPPSPNQSNRIIRQIDCSHESKAGYLWQPYDFMIISSHFATDNQNTFIDGTANSMTPEEFQEKLDKVEEPEMMFFALSSVCWSTDLEYFRKAKKQFKNCLKFVIGDIFVEEPYREIILKECDGIIFLPHLIDINEMAKLKDDPSIDLTGVWTKENWNKPLKKRPIRTQIATYPQHQMFLSRNYRFPFSKQRQFATVTTSWGCPFTCTYCTDSNYPAVVRSVENVVDELRELHKLGVRELFFSDKSFGYPKPNAMKLLAIMANEFKFSFTCYTQPSQYAEDFYQALKAAGCHTIIIGIDTYNTEVLKKYRRFVTREDVEKLVYHADKLKINVCADFILGLEGETAEDMERTIQYSLKLPLDFASFNVATPLPGSTIRKKAMEEGILKVGEESFDTLGNKEVLDSDMVKAEKLAEIRQRAVRKFYLRPSYLLRRLSRTDTLSYLFNQLGQMWELFLKPKYKPN